MKKIHRQSLYTTAKSCSITLLSASIAICIINSAGLVSWADKLENGILKTTATPIVASIDKLVMPLGFAPHHAAIISNIHDLDTWLTQPIYQSPKAVTAEPQPSDNPAETNITSAKADTPSENTPKTSTQETLMPLELVLSDAKLETLPPVPINTPFSENLASLSQKSTLSIALVGDSMMAVGLAPMLQKSAPMHQYVRANKSGTGLSRPDVFDWMAEYPKMLKGQTVDLAFVSIGANDAQDYYINGTLIRFGSNEWLRVYGNRVNNFIKLLESNNTQVIWVGMPHMKSSKFDQKIDLLNRLSYHIIKERYPHVTWYNGSSVIDEVVGDTTVYREYGEDETGKKIRLRVSDGIHLSTDGAGLIAKKLLTWHTPTTSQTPTSN